MRRAEKTSRNPNHHWFDFDWLAIIHARSNQLFKLELGEKINRVTFSREQFLVDK